MAPSALIDPIVFEKANDDKGTPLLEQLALAILLDRGEVDRHVRRTRLVYRRRRDALVEALARHVPTRGPTGRRRAPCRPPAPGSPRRPGGRRSGGPAGVAAVSLSEHRTLPAGPALILGYAQIADAAIVAGVRELAFAVRDVSSGA